jgi:hypothetical protein
MGYYYLYLRHHGEPTAASALLEDPRMKWQPDLIQQFVKKYVPNPNINFVCRSNDIVRAIVLHQAEADDSEFYDAMEDELKEVGDPKLLSFRVYTSSSDNIFSSGNRFDCWKDNFPGFNFYGEILEEFAKVVGHEESVKSNLFGALLDNLEYFSPAEYYSVLIISDSQTKFFDNIVGGTVIAVRGGTYGHIVDVFRNGMSIPYQKYKWIIIYCGTNCYLQPGRYDFQQRQHEWRALRKILVAEAQRREDEGRQPSVLYCCAFDHPGVPGNAGHSAFIEDDLEGTPVLCINWSRIGNPFLDDFGHLKSALFESGKCGEPRRNEKHLSHSGLRLMWKTWCTRFPGLRCLPYTLSPVNKGVSKQTFSRAPEAFELPQEPGGPSTSGHQDNRSVASGHAGRAVAVSSQQRSRSDQSGVSGSAGHSAASDSSQRRERSQHRSRSGQSSASGSAGHLAVSDSPHRSESSGRSSVSGNAGHSGAPSSSKQRKRVDQSDVSGDAGHRTSSSLPNLRVSFCPGVRSEVHIVEQDSEEERQDRAPKKSKSTSETPSKRPRKG